MREIRFRFYGTFEGKDKPSMMYGDKFAFTEYAPINDQLNSGQEVVMQYTGLKDRNGKDIYFDDILRFADKWEWYRGQYGIKMMFANQKEKKKLQEQYEAEPYEQRIIEGIEDYEWLLSSEIQSYWEVVGNIHENPNLLNPAQ